MFEVFSSASLFAILGGPPGLYELLIVAFIVLLLFGGRLPSVMKNMGLGIKEFKKGMTGGDDDVEKSEETPSEGDKQPTA